MFGLFTSCRLCSTTSIVTIDDCTHVVDSCKQLRLLGLSKRAGPYVIKAGKIPVGAFGFNSLAEPLEYVSTPGHLQQMKALGMAYRAMHIIKEQYPRSNDPVLIRETGRRAYRMAFEESMRAIAV